MLSEVVVSGQEHASVTNKLPRDVPGPVLMYKVVLPEVIRAIQHEVIPEALHTSGRRESALQLKVVEKVMSESLAIAL